MISQQPCPTLSTSRLASAVRSPFAASLLAKAQSIAQERCQSLQSASRSLAEQLRTFTAAPAVGPLCQAPQGWHTLSALVRRDGGTAAPGSLFDRGNRGLLARRHPPSTACAASPETPAEALPVILPAASGQRPAAPAPPTPLFATVQWLFVQQLDTLMKGRADSVDYMSADMRVCARSAHTLQQGSCDGLDLMPRCGGDHSPGLRSCSGTKPGHKGL